MGYSNFLTNCPTPKGSVPSLMTVQAGETKHRPLKLVHEDRVLQRRVEGGAEEEVPQATLYHSQFVFLELQPAMQKSLGLWLEDPLTVHLKIQYFVSVFLQSTVFSSFQACLYSKFPQDRFSIEKVVCLCAYNFFISILFNAPFYRVSLMTYETCCRMYEPPFGSPLHNKITQNDINNSRVY